MEEKFCGRLKHKPEDFVVEEIGEKWKCKVSGKFNPEEKIDIEFLKKQETQDFLWCEMEKLNIDHFQAIKELSFNLDKAIYDIGYAGTKDRFAHTSQRISIFKPNLELIEKFSHPKIKLKNFKWSKRKIKIGYLDANHFTIAIRQIDKKDASKVANSIKKSKWFPNYFGEQRFGSLRKNNFEIGKCIIKRDFEGAIWKILTDESSEEREEVTLARRRLKKEKNFTEALNYFPENLRNERHILFNLSRNNNNFLEAIKSADRKTILMIVNSVQSKIFNEILKKALDEGLDFTREGHKNCILAGYKTKFYDGKLGEIEKEILSKNKINLEDFDVKEIPYLRIKGAYRKAITLVEDLKVNIEEDEEFINSKKIVLSFTLPSGVYATTYLDNFFSFAK